MNLFRKLQAYLQLTNAISKADRCHAMDGDNYYVISGINGKLLVTDRKHFKMLKRKGYIKKNKTMLDVRLGCYYCTGGPYGQESMMPEELRFRRKQFYKWKEYGKKGY